MIEIAYFPKPGFSRIYIKKHVICHPKYSFILLESDRTF